MKAQVSPSSSHSVSTGNAEVEDAMYKKNVSTVCQCEFCVIKLRSHKKKQLTRQKRFRDRKENVAV